MLAPGMSLRPMQPKHAKLVRRGDRYQQQGSGSVRNQGFGQRVQVLVAGHIIDANWLARLDAA